MKKNNFIKLVPYLIVILIVMSLFAESFFKSTTNFSSGYFTNNYNKLNIKDVDVDVRSNVLKISGTLKEGERLKKFNVTVPNTKTSYDILDNISKEQLKGEKKNIKFYDSSETGFFKNLLIQLLPLAIMIGIAFFFFSRMGGQNKAFEFVKSKARKQVNVKTRFKDVAGAEEEKQEVAEIIDYLKNPKKYSEMGARVPKGILMEGPPGTGKTLLAKAVAGEANVPFFSISGSDFVEMFVGAGASRVRDMFKEAKKHMPCVIFIDEIDAVGRQRGAGLGGGNDEREQTLNQMLVEMDGMEDNLGIVIIAATNRVDVLDPALLRSGRFDRRIRVSLPDKKAREQILKVHIRNKKLDKDVNLENLAKRTPGFSGADLENVLNEGAILAIRDNRKTINMNDLDEAIDRVMMGPAKKSKKYNDEEKKLVAFHESGHAVVGIKLKDSNKVQKITIIPRGDAGGYNLMLPENEKYFPTKKSLLAEITGFMGGRVAEELIFNEISAGASSDIEKATKIAKTMVSYYGMSDLGPIQYTNNNQSVFLGRDYGSGMSYSPEIAHEIDIEVRKIITYCYEEAKKIISDNKDLLHLIANTLIEEETITAEQINNLEKYGSINAPTEENNQTESEVLSDQKEQAV